MAIFNSFLYVYQRVSHHIIICKILETHFFLKHRFWLYIYIYHASSLWDFGNTIFFLGGVGIPRDWTDWEAGKSSFKVLDLLGEFGEWVALFRSLGRHD